MIGENVQAMVMEINKVGVALAHKSGGSIKPSFQLKTVSNPMHWTPSLAMVPNAVENPPLVLIFDHPISDFYIEAIGGASPCRPYVLGWETPEGSGSAIVADEALWPGLPSNPGEEFVFFRLAPIERTLQRVELWGDIAYDIITVNHRPRRVPKAGHSYMTWGNLQVEKALNTTKADPT